MLLATTAALAVLGLHAQPSVRPTPARASALARPPARVRMNLPEDMGDDFFAPAGVAKLFKGVFGGKKPQPRPTRAKAEPPVVIREDYTLAAIFVALGTALFYAGSSVPLPYVGLLLEGPGVLGLLLGALFAVQASRIRFVFDDEAFELKMAPKSLPGDDDAPDGLQASGENILVGGANRWPYRAFVNWAFFPDGWLEAGLPPILVYFKENQTPESEWDAGPGALANSAEKVAQGAVRGQVHFFPVLCDAKQMAQQFEKRGCRQLPKARAS